MADRDLYRILGMARTATDAELRKAYRDLARKYHPDRNPGDDTAEEKFKDIAFAKDVLTSKRKKLLYDEFGEIGLREGFNAEAYRRYRNWQDRVPGGGGGINFEDLLNRREAQHGKGRVSWSSAFQDIMGSDVGDVMEALFGGAAASRSSRRKQDLISDISIDFSDAVRGTETELAYQVPGNPEPRKIRVRIPAGVKDGGRIRLRAQGVDGGDLVLKVEVRPHAHFRREGLDLHVELPVTVGEAYRGAKIEVPTPEGAVMLSVPRGIKSGAKLRLRKRGVRSRGRRQEVGDLIAHVQIRLPGAEHLEDAIDQLEAAYETSPRDGLEF